LNYATDKLNVREGDPLFLLPRMNEKISLKPALIKREPEWCLGSEITQLGKIKLSGEPTLETFIL
jgi:hypothetical protein